MTDGLSVLIPTYNPDSYEIRKLLTTLIDQNDVNFEIIIANDGDDFYSRISDIVSYSKRVIKYKTNEQRLGLYFSIRENLKYCEYNDILVLEQDIIPLTNNFIKNILSLHNESPSSVITSKLMISGNTDYRKYVFYKRRIPNLGIITDHSEDTGPNQPVSFAEVETAFTKADLLNKEVFKELNTRKSVDTITSQDIILSSLIRKNRKLITSDSIKCEIAASDPAKTGFFLRKEFLYGKSVLNVLRHANSETLASTAYFREKLFRLLFTIIEGILIAASLIPFFPPTIRTLLAVFIVLIGLAYTQWILFKTDFWQFSRFKKHKFIEAIKASIYIIALDAAYVGGVVTGLLRHVGQPANNFESG